MQILYLRDPISLQSIVVLEPFGIFLPPHLLRQYLQEFFLCSAISLSNNLLHLVTSHVISFYCRPPFSSAVWSASLIPWSRVPRVRVLIESVREYLPTTTNPLYDPIKWMPSTLGLRNSQVITFLRPNPQNWALVNYVESEPLNQTLINCVGANVFIKNRNSLPYGSFVRRICFGGWKEDIIKGA